MHFLIFQIFNLIIFIRQTDQMMGRKIDRLQFGAVTEEVFDMEFEGYHNYKALPENLQKKLFNRPQKPTFAKLFFKHTVEKEDDK
jgi:hypothetical protein